MEAQPIGDGSVATDCHQEPMAQDSSESLHGIYRFTLDNLSQKSFNIIAQGDGQTRPVECKIERVHVQIDGSWTGSVVEFYAKCADATDQQTWNELQPVQLRIANQRLEGEYFWRWVRPDLKQARNGWVYLFRLHWRDLVKAEYGYVENDSLMLELVTK